jgi:hypothetical protein
MHVKVKGLHMYMYIVQDCLVVRQTNAQIYHSELEKRNLKKTLHSWLIVVKVLKVLKLFCGIPPCTFIA